ncbi:MAG: ABC transporter substrate-binding protein [Gemmatimonadales bacterium]|nr:ABC transporter substrate-binding protein [Gemmatimonadales bacterium]
MRRLAFVVALGAAACVGGPERGPAAGGRELVVGAGADATPSGAFQARLGVYPLNTNVAEPLVQLTSDFHVQPLLATRWEYRGANTWRFFLRPGVRFHDGQVLTSRAVKESLLQVVNARQGYSFLDEHSFRLPNDTTVEITPTEPNLRLPEQLVHPNYSIFAPGTNPGVRPVGTGPFRFIAYRPNDRIRVARNDSYWGERAILDRITFRFFPDATTRVLALTAGEVDLIVDLPREQVGTIVRRPDLRVARASPGLILALQVNSHGREPHGLLADRRLRHAIGLAIDRGGLVRQVWGGEADTVQNMTVPQVLGAFADSVRGFPFDPRAAADVLERAGWTRGPAGIRVKGGRPLRLTLLANPETDMGTAEFVQAELRRVGMDVTWLKLPDLGSYAARLARGEFDLNLSVSNQNDANPLFLPALIYHSRSTRPFARWHLAGARFDQVVDSGMRVADPVQARHLAARAIHLAVDEEAVLIPIAALYRLYGMKRTIGGFLPHPSQTNQSWSGVTVEATAAP